MNGMKFYCDASLQRELFGKTPKLHFTKGSTIFPLANAAEENYDKSYLYANVL